MRATVIRLVPKLVRIPPVRRVIGQGEDFVCGICKNPYPDIAEAYSCLHHCWQEFVAAPLVVKRRRKGGGIVFRCRLCGQHYYEKDRADLCAGECLQRSDAQFAEELYLNEMPAQVDSTKRPLRRSSSPAYTSRKVVSRFKLKHGGSTGAAPAGADPAPTPAPSQASAPVAAPGKPAANANPLPTRSEDERRKKSAFKQGWHRANAKYACDFCHHEYFTKVEVTVCFDGHFDDNGLEKPPG